MLNILATLMLFGLPLFAAGSATAAPEIVPIARKAGDGYQVDPRDQAVNLAICGSRCDDQDATRKGYVTNGGWRPIAERPGATRIFVVSEYAYDYEHHPQASPQAQALCGSRCNAISDNLKSYLTPMGWRLIKVPGVQSRVITLDGPEVTGQCICRGDEYLVEPEYREKRDKAVAEISGRQ